MKRFSILLLAALLTGCGPFVSGTWTDDPKNWKRAFNETRPGDGISIVHSWFMRTPHFTAEFAWFFELELSEDAKKELLASPQLVKLSGVSIEALYSRMYQDRPSWFSPKPLAAFDVFESKEHRDFLVFVEKSGRRSFWSALHL